MLGTTDSLFWREGRGPLSELRKPPQWKGGGVLERFFEGPPLLALSLLQHLPRGCSSDPRGRKGVAVLHVLDAGGLPGPSAL